MNHSASVTKTIRGIASRKKLKLSVRDDRFNENGASAVDLLVCLSHCRPFRKIFACIFFEFSNKFRVRKPTFWESHSNQRDK